MKDLCIIIVNRDRPDLTNKLWQQITNMCETGKISHDVVTVEMGSKKKNLSENWTIWYADRSFRGKCYGHNVGLWYALGNPLENYDFFIDSEIRNKRLSGKHRYYLFLMNDVVFTNKYDLKKMIRIMDICPQVGVLSPCNPSAMYIGCKPEKNRYLHYVVTCDYLALMIRKGAIDEVGFLNQKFKYCWGAIHDYAYRLYKNAYDLMGGYSPNNSMVAYCDEVLIKHLGGTTYGKVKGVISRDVYKKRACKFALSYFTKKFGKNWDKKMTEVLPKFLRGRSVNTFIRHRKKWENE